MKEFRGKVAVVTGAASGIGLALAEEFASLGMRVVLADIEKEALERADQMMREKGAEHLSVLTDVSIAAEVDALAKKAVNSFGGVHILCNNAGVMGGGTAWEMPLEDYAWHLGVNLWGVIHGIRSFIPIMMAQNTEAHIVNTSSQSGLSCTPYTAAYCASKHAVVALSECLYHELSLSGSRIKVSVLLPTSVMTNIDNAERNRPKSFTTAHHAKSDIADLVKDSLTKSLKGGIEPQKAAEQVIEAIRREHFYIFTKGGDSDMWRRLINIRLHEISNLQNPSFSIADELLSRQ
jgi:NAD(P)-dependent dehydrogenase (short-subunit alcohol dehydrogenase family)